MAMASDHRITVTVEEPPTATSPLENISDSSMEDEAEISQPSDIDQPPKGNEDVLGVAILLAATAAPVSSPTSQGYRARPLLTLLLLSNSQTQTPRVVKMAWKPLPPFRFAAASVDVGARSSPMGLYASARSSPMAAPDNK
ncbi:hypothetical protein V6N11_027219 [Hibiscus sabdariffa]|uniref:Uncharacterized protein n=1 Tax=Hibiscus sabdariffa TaxID=183260 RepID=A0ABR2PGR5_9ROSI